MINKKIIVTLTMGLTLLSTIQAKAFTRISYIVDKNGNIKSDLTKSEIRSGLKLKNSNPGKLKSIEAFQKNPKSIKIYVNGTVLLSDESIQTSLDSSSFLNAVIDAVNLWNNIPTSKAVIEQPILSILNVDAMDGRNLITAKTNTAIEGAAAKTTFYNITNIATGKKATINGEEIQTKPGQILDVDTVINPSKDKCVAVYTTVGDINIGGNDDPSVYNNGDGGWDYTKATDNCEDKISVGDVTDIAVQGIGRVLGLEDSALTSSALGDAGRNKVRYNLTNDDKIGVSNLYPNEKEINNLGTIYGKAVLNKIPVVGAHIVLENTTTGEVVAGALTNYKGEYKIKAIPTGNYILYVEPLDGAVRPKTFLSTNGKNADINFRTGVSSNFVIGPGTKKRLNFKVVQNDGPALNLNPKVFGLSTDAEITDSGGNAIAPITCTPGTSTSFELWGENIDENFGTLTISGSDVTINSISNATVKISSEDDADSYPGLSITVYCQPNAIPGPRNIKFILDKLDPLDPAYNLVDLISGAFVVQEN